MTEAITRPSGYAALPHLAGKSFLPLSWLTRLPAAMLPVGTMTLLTATTGSIAQAGIGSGAVGAGTAIGAPLVGMSVDRWGQRKVLLPVGLACALSLLGVVVSAATSSIPFFVSVIFCFLAGLTTPQIPVMVRARWLHLIERAEDALPLWKSRATSAAFSYESMADELSYVAGPVLVGVLASAIGNPGPLTFAAVTTALGVIWFSWHWTSPPVVAAAEVSPGDPSAATKLPAITWAPILGMLMLGAYFGATLAVVTAFARGWGSPDSAGLYYGAMGITSAICALLMVRLPDRFTLPMRWIATGTLITIAGLALPFISAPIGLVITLAILGCGVGPVMVTMFSIVNTYVPPARSSLAMTFLSAGLVTGQAISSPIAGKLVDASGTEVAGFAPPVCTLVLTICGVVALLHEQKKS